MVNDNIKAKHLLLGENILTENNIIEFKLDLKSQKIDDRYRSVDSFNDLVVITFDTKINNDENTLSKANRILNFSSNHDIKGFFHHQLLDNPLTNDYYLIDNKFLDKNSLLHIYNVNYHNPNPNLYKYYKSFESDIENYETSIKDCEIKITTRLEIDTLNKTFIPRLSENLFIFKIK
ncbi:MAG: hypothetical protein ACOC3V_03455 [bacterium]